MEGPSNERLKKTLRWMIGSDVTWPSQARSSGVSSGPMVKNKSDGDPGRACSEHRRDVTGSNV